MIGFYHAHGTSEQCHSEIKTDMDLERLPSGKFATNATMSSLGLVAYNVLRLCGQGALHEQRRLPAEDRAAGQEGFPSAVAERDSRLDVLGGEVDAAREPLAAVVLAEQPVGRDVASVVRAFCGLPIVRSG